MFVFVCVCVCVCVCVGACIERMCVHERLLHAHQTRCACSAHILMHEGVCGFHAYARKGTEMRLFHLCVFGAHVYKHVRGVKTCAEYVYLRNGEEKRRRQQRDLLSSNM